MSDTESTHVGSAGPSTKRRRRAQVPGPRPVVRKPVVGIGRHEARHFDPVTGRRRKP